MQNLSTDSTVNYELQRKITNKIIRKEKSRYERKIIEKLEINRYNP